MTHPSPYRAAHALRQAATFNAHGLGGAIARSWLREFYREATALGADPVPAIVTASVAIARAR